MNVRQATERDSERIEGIAAQSFEASYSLSPLDIESILEIEFAPDELASRMEDDGRVFLVAERDDEPVGFVEGKHEGNGTGEIRWLHVAPTERGQDAGTELFEHVLADLREHVAENIQATVLSDNQEGGEFCQQFGFESHGQTEREFAERTVHMEVYSTDESEPADEEFTVPEDEEITVDGERRFLDTQEQIAGTEAQILPVFADASHGEHYGFYCTNCGTFTDSVDGQGKIVCENCGNEHRPEEWDGSYL